MSESVPGRLDEHATAIQELLGDAGGLLLGLDFDGTLAPIVEDPDAATVDPACRDRVASLAEREDVEVAIVSGRALADVKERAPMTDVTYAGNHGLALDRGNGPEIHPAAADHRESVRRVVRAVADALADVDGVVVEDKGLTATVHYRKVADGEVPRVREAVERAVAAADADLLVSEGKEILEVRPDVSRDKGAVLAQLGGDCPADWATVYVGDDVTDEDAFERIEPEGIGVRVGGDRATAASLRLADRTDVGPFLAVIEGILDEERGSTAQGPEREGTYE